MSNMGHDVYIDWPWLLSREDNIPRGVICLWDSYGERKFSKKKKKSGTLASYIFSEQF